jgi:hypothetical protein
MAVRITGRLFRAQSLSRIGGCGTHSRQCRREECQQQHEDHAREVNNRISGADFEEERADEARHAKRSQNTESTGS